MARGRSSGYARTPSREKRWEVIPSIVLAGSSTPQTLLGGSIAFTEARTIVRCRASIATSIDGPTISDQCRFIIGLGIVSTDAFAVGSTAMSDPNGDADYPWLWWYQSQLQSQVNVANDAALSAAERITVDSKAMRKVKPWQSLVWVVAYEQTNASPVADIMIGITRVLIYE